MALLAVLFLSLSTDALGFRPKVRQGTCGSDAKAPAIQPGNAVGVNANEEARSFVEVREGDASRVESTTGHNRTRNGCVVVWFHGDHTLLKSGPGKEVCNKDPFLYAGHFAVANTSGHCRPVGWGPKMAPDCSGTQALEMAKTGATWPGAWTDDEHHFQNACRHGLQVFYNRVECGSGVVPPASTPSDLFYGFPPRNGTPSLNWLRTTFNCITMTTAMSKLAQGAGSTTGAGMRCLSTGRIKDCDETGISWCSECCPNCYGGR